MAAAGHAEGGPVTGPGGPTSDTVPIMASPGEWVISAAAVNHYGSAMFAQLNARRYADGGEVSAAPSAYAAARYVTNTPPNVTIEGAHMTGTLDMGNGLVGVIDARVARGFVAAARSNAGTRSTVGRTR
jgi:hypothetical protein